jgi:alpha-1,6-mannosyltransferase
VARTVGLCVLVVVGGALWWRARGRDLPGILRHAGWALVAATALAPVFHPWYWLWPFAVLAAAGAPSAEPGAVTAGGTGGAGAGTTARRLIGLTAALAFLVLPDGYNLARATRLPGALAVASLVVAGLVRLVRLAPRRLRSGQPTPD